MNAQQSSSFKHIRLGVHAGVAHLVLARPDKLNVLGFGPGGSRSEISLALQQAEASIDVGCILISAEGRAFSAGGDVAGLPEIETPIDDYRMVQEVDAFNANVRALSKPVIALVHGKCLGSALSFISQCDFVLASDDALFGLPEGRFGHPGGSELVTQIGTAWAKFMIYSGELIDAKTAVEIGLALLLLPGDARLQHATELAERIARMPREAVTLNKASIDRAAEAGGRGNARIAGRAADVITKSMSRFAKAPDGRTFESIISSEGMEGMKRAREQQYTDPWLQRIKAPRNAS